MFSESCRTPAVHADHQSARHDELTDAGRVKGIKVDQQTVSILLARKTLAQSQDGALSVT